MPEFLHHPSAGRAELIDLIAPMVQNWIVASYPTPRDARVQGVELHRRELERGAIVLIEDKSER